VIENSTWSRITEQDIGLCRCQGELLLNVFRPKRYEAFSDEHVKTARQLNEQERPVGQQSLHRVRIEVQLIVGTAERLVIVILLNVTTSSTC